MGLRFVGRDGRPSATSGSRVAFTLIELLVVIAIIAVGFGLLAAGILRVREAANRTACQNNMRQLGIALHGHVTMHGAFPRGSTNESLPWGGPRTTWPVHLYPYLEQQAAYDKFVANNRGAPPGSISWSLNPNSLGDDAPTAAVVQSLLCPDDGWGKQKAETSSGTYAFSNYLGFFGDIDYGAGLPDAAPANKRAAFGLNYGARPGDITDGLSHTMVVGEYLRGLPDYADDLRGMMWSDRPGESQLYTQLPPNSSQPDLLQPEFSHDRPDLNLPCKEASPLTSATAASRSRHPGGVNVLLADGAVRFVGNDIGLAQWRALGTIAAGDGGDDDAAPPDPPAPPAPASPPPPSGDKYVVVLNNTVRNPATVAAQLAGTGCTISRLYDVAPKGFAVQIPDNLVATVRRDPRVRHLERDQTYHTCVQTIPTGIRRINATQSHAKSGSGTSTVRSTVAVIDTGIDLTHPDLNVVLNRSFIAGIATGNDDNGHGTHVSGTIAAKDNSFGVVGVAPGANLWALKALDSTGSGFTSDIMAALNFVAANANQCQIVNMSLGGPFSLAFNNAVDAATAQGVTVVVAAGNSTANAAGFSPASAPTAICVAALADSDGLPGGVGGPTSAGPDDTFATFSNFGNVVTVIAPGVDILSTWPQTIAPNNYNTISGTSMASPHVAGLVALIKDPRTTSGPIDPRIRNIGRRVTSTPNATPAQIRQMILGASGQQIPGIHAETRTYPLINAAPF